MTPPPSQDDMLHHQSLGRLEAQIAAILASVQGAEVDRKAVTDSLHNLRVDVGRMEERLAAVERQMHTVHSTEVDVARRGAREEYAEATSDNRRGAFAVRISALSFVLSALMALAFFTGWGDQ